MTRIYADYDEVVLQADEETRRFWTPRRGGSVYEVSSSRPGTLGHLVCNGLSHRGGTLYVATRDGLLALIRAERREIMQRRRQAAEAARW